VACKHEKPLPKAKNRRALPGTIFKMNEDDSLVSNPQNTIENTDESFENLGITSRWTNRATAKSMFFSFFSEVFCGKRL
jgi:hypothetical protein